MSIFHNKLHIISSKKTVIMTPVFYFIDIFVPHLEILLGYWLRQRWCAKFRLYFIGTPSLYKNAKALINLGYNYLWWLIYDKRKDSAVDMNLLLLSINCVWVAVITLMLFLYILVFQKIHKKKARFPGSRMWTILPLWLGTCWKCFIGFISELETS